MTAETGCDVVAVGDGEGVLEGSDLAGRCGEALAGGAGGRVGRALSAGFVIDRVTGRLRSVGESVKLSEFGRPGRDEAREDE